MENHPIPQDVTGFQFKLIGNMTVKQFAYVGFGAIMAVVLYYAPIFILIKLPFIVLFPLVAVLLAFVPFEGRPMDVMMGNFLKALFTPNQYIFQKSSDQFALLTVSTSPKSGKPEAKPVPKEAPHVRKDAQLATLLSQVHSSSSPTSALDVREKRFMSMTSDFTNTSTTPPVAPSSIQASSPIIIEEHSAPVVPPLPSPQISMEAATTPLPISPSSLSSPLASVTFDAPTGGGQSSSSDMSSAVLKQIQEETKELEKKREEEEKESQKLQKAREEAEEAKKAGLSPEETTKERQAIDMETELKKFQLQKEQLEKDILRLQEQAAAQKQKVFTPGQSTAAPKEQTQFAKTIAAPAAAKVGVMQPAEAPNLIVGIIKDSRGNILSNILVEIKDKEGNAVRAFKTNQLGQFATATPLMNGTYTLVFEDLKAVHKFDAIEITADGTLLPPLEITSHDAREDLRKELFS